MRYGSGVGDSKGCLPLQFLQHLTTDKTVMRMIRSRRLKVFEKRESRCGVE